MQFTHIDTITTKPGQMADFLRKTEIELLPLYRELPGFVALTVAKTSDKWMKDAIGQLVDDSHNRIGDLPFVAVTHDLHTYVSAVAPVAGGVKA